MTQSSLKVFLYLKLVFSKFAPDLKIIDLPGLTRISVRNLNT
jgi:hypothetical protein